MPFEMQSVLAQCTIEDFELVKDLICTKSGFFGSVWDTFNGVRTDLVEQLFEQYKAERSPEKKQQLMERLEREIRYLGGHDFVTLARRIFSDSLAKNPSGASFRTLVDDASKTLKVKQKAVGTTEHRLKRLTATAIEKMFSELTEDQQREYFRKNGVSARDTESILNAIKSNSSHLIQALFLLLDRPVAIKLLSELALGLATKILGSAITRSIMELLARIGFPDWLIPMLGPLNVAWIASDVAGPAYRKTVPILLCLGMAAIRADQKSGDKDWVPDENDA